MSLFWRAALAVACACALAACAQGPSALGGSAPTAGDPLPTKLSRDAAIAVVRARDDQVGRVDRTEARLLTWKEYVDLAGPPGAVNADPKASPHLLGEIGIAGDPELRVVWAVAVSGEVWPQLRVPIFFGPLPHPSATPNPSYRWGLFLVDANAGGLIGAVDAGIDDSWPPLFAKLPDHPAALAAEAAADPCASLARLPDIASPSRFPARTLAELMANLPRDVEWMRTLQGVSGAWSGALWDPRVPRCRVDLIVIGTPYFARAYPAATGTWHVPLMVGNDVILTAFVTVDDQGVGTLSGNQGGAIPAPTEAEARAAAALPSDAVISAELILARPPGCGASPMVVWRLVRASGTAVYFAFSDFHGKPQGILIEEKDMRFSSALSPRAASVLRAC